jgi:beta-lactamase regulating signal transducer with metallopeptidase domain
MLLDLALRATLVLAIAFAATIALRRSAAATRHLVWTLAVVSVLALPALMLMLPAWRILPDLDVSLAPHERVAPALRAAENVPQPVDVARPSTGANAASRPERVAQPLTAAIFTSSLAVAIWVFVTCVLLVRFASGVAAVRRLARHAHPADARSRALVERIALGAGVRAPIRLRVSPDVAMPMTWGGRQPLLLLPSSARDWSDERLRVVLLHEVAHIRRGDWLTHALCHVMAACHWFNPLAWKAMRAMTRERERACDDYVLGHGAAASEYAQHLLDLARADQGGGAWAIAPAMARPSELEGRLLSILTPHRLDAGRAIGRLLTVAAVAAAVATATAAPSTPPEAPQAAVRPLAPPRPASRAPRQLGVDNPTREDNEREHQAVDALSDALDDSSREVRESAALGLAMSESASAIAPLIEALQDPDPQVREKAALGLGFRSESSVIDPLLAALGDEDAQVREKAAIGLGLRRSPRVTDALLAAASDPDSQVREKVIMALGLSGDARATSVIVAATKDPDGQVREKAIAALTILNQDSAALQEAVRAGIAGAMRLFGNASQPRQP